MPFTKGIEIMGSLNVALAEKYTGVNLLSELMVPFYEGEVTLHMISDDFKSPVFMFNKKRGVIEVFTGGMNHVRDHTEASRDFWQIRERLDSQYKAEQEGAREDIARLTVESKDLAKKLADAHDSPDTSALRLGRIGEQLATARMRLKLARETISNVKPKISSSMWLALALNAPHRIKVGELGRMLARLRDQKLNEFGGVLPRSSEADYDKMIRLKVKWN